MSTTPAFPIEFFKGHGTQNDFIIIPDAQAQLALSPGFIAQLCDRQQGIGADGVLRVAETKHLIDQGIIVDSDASSTARYFMDYYNADGSIAEMCGNGSRVFAHWLVASGWETATTFAIGTRAGDKQVTVTLEAYDRAQVSVEMGQVTVLGETRATIENTEYAGLGIDVGNPHLVVVHPEWDAAAIANLDLATVGFDSKFFPQGVNVECATAIDNDSMTMRVFERGVGETRSCGTGTVATARAGLAACGEEFGEVTVHIPGGSVKVVLGEGGATLTGPSRLVAHGQVAAEL